MRSNEYFFIQCDCLSDLIGLIGREDNSLWDALEKGGTIELYEAAIQCVGIATADEVAPSLPFTSFMAEKAQRFESDRAIRQRPALYSGQCPTKEATQPQASPTCIDHRTRNTRADIIMLNKEKTKL